MNSLVTTLPGRGPFAAGDHSCRVGFIVTRCRDRKQSLMAQPPPNQPGADDLFALHGLDPGLAAPPSPEPARSVSAAASSNAAKNSSKKRLHPLADRLFRPVRLAKFACLVGLSVFVPYLIQRLPQLAARPEYRLETTKIRVVPAPASRD